jgi:hypothetical protein
VCCHGNDQASNRGAAVWTGAAPTCTTCHGQPPGTGEHDFHVNEEGVGCDYCHGAMSSSTHVNGNRELSSALLWQANNRSCDPVCHGRWNW